MWDWIKGEFIDIIEWLDESNDTLVYRFERHDNEIKHGAKLIVREGQMAVFVNEGQIADIFKPGTYTLETRNIPILSTLQGWKYGFDSPFKAEAYFVSTRRFTDQKWGTKNPIMLRDPEFGPVRLRAFGNYAFRITEADKFLKEVVGTDGHFTTAEITEQLRNIIVARFSNAVGQSKIPILDMAGNYTELSEFVTNIIGPEFEAYGLQLTKLLVENISLPANVEEALDKRSSMGIIGNMHQYQQYQAAEAMRAAAENSGGAMDSSMGLGMGFVLAQQMGQSFQNAQQAAPAGAPPVGAPPPPPAPNQLKYFVYTNGQQAGPFGIQELQRLVDGGQLTKQTQVWAQGMTGWQAAGAVDALDKLFPSTPPPLPGVTFYLSIHGQQSGPFDMGSLEKQVQGGQLTPQTLVWKQGMPSWQPAEGMEELAQLFAKLAPPPPPPPPPPPQ